MDKLVLFKLKRQMNPSQLELFERLVEILPDKKGKTFIEGLVAMHILGIPEDDRIKRTLKSLRLPKGVKFENK